MKDLVQLMRENPFGTFVLLAMIITGIFGTLETCAASHALGR